MKNKLLFFTALCFISNPAYSKPKPNLSPDYVFYNGNVFTASQSENKNAIAIKDGISRFDVLAVMRCYAATLAILAYVGWHEGRRHWYFAGLALAALIALYHYTLIRGRDRGLCFKAFLHNNWFGAVVFAGLAFDFVFNPMVMPPR